MAEIDVNFKMKSILENEIVSFRSLRKFSQEEIDLKFVGKQFSVINHVIWKQFNRFLRQIN